MTTPNLRDRLQASQEGTTTASEGLRIKSTSIFGCTVGEILEACSKNAKHPNAITFQASLKNKPTDYTVYIDAVDLQAVLDDVEVKTVVMQEVRSGHAVTVYRKQVTPPKETPDSLQKEKKGEQLKSTK